MVAEPITPGMVSVEASTRLSLTVAVAGTLPSASGSLKTRSMVSPVCIRLEVPPPLAALTGSPPRRRSVGRRERGPVAGGVAHPGCARRERDRARARRGISRTGPLVSASVSPPCPRQRRPSSAFRPRARLRATWASFRAVGRERLREGDRHVVDLAVLSSCPASRGQWPPVARRRSARRRRRRRPGCRVRSTSGGRRRRPIRVPCRRALSRREKAQRTRERPRRRGLWPGQSQARRSAGRRDVQKTREGSGGRTLSAGGAASLLRNWTQPTPRTELEPAAETFAATAGRHARQTSQNPT